MIKYYTTTKVAQLCHVSPGSVVRWIKEEKLKAALTAGGHHRVAHNDLVIFMKSLGLPPPEDQTLIKEEKQNQATRVLIVEDDPQVRGLLKHFFENQPEAYEISEAENGFDAGWVAHKKKPDLMILDLALPGMNGYQVCQVVRRNAELNQCRIIVISGDREQKKERVFNLGADDFIEKPFSLETLRECLDSKRNDEKRPRAA